MSTIEAQLELEERMVARGMETYLANQRKAEGQDRGSELDYSRRLIKEYILDMVEHLKAFLLLRGPGKMGSARYHLRNISPEKAMFIGLKGLFNSFTSDKPLISIATGIGRMVEDEIRFTRFQETHKEYYETIIADFKRKKSENYRYKRRVLVHSANTKEDEWLAWTVEERLHVGTKLLDIILEHSDLVKKESRTFNSKTETTLVPTEAAMKWINDYEDTAALMHAERSPCIIEPDDWTDLDQGGYYSPNLRQHTLLVKTSGARQAKLVKSLDMSKIMAAVNHIQKTEWSVNQEVLGVVKAIWANNLGIGMPGTEKLVPRPSPVLGIEYEAMTEEQREAFASWKMEASEVYTKEKERVGKSFQVARIIRMANEYVMHNRFWFVWTADFRGRLYSATAGFSPQGPDVAKGLLQFYRGKPLGPKGLHWLKVHGANRYGYDKEGYDERVAWVDERHDEFMRAASDPLSYREVWAGADKPFQFLAFLFEYRRVHELVALGYSAESFISHLPIGLDGSCNGLQNLSACLRDEVGGRATNLVPQSKPADIYTEVATVCTHKLRASEVHLDKTWVEFIDRFTDGRIGRSFAKRPVMTLPYGATRNSCTKYIFLSILETENKFFPANFKAACQLTPTLWQSIGEVVVAARVAMDWLQKCATIISKENAPIVWLTPDGFPVVQDSRKIETKQVDTQLSGRFQMRVGIRTNKIDSAKQRSGISPNFVHSLDATHLRMTVLVAKEKGIESLAVIHDDFGTHAGDTEELHWCIRDAFVRLYTEHDPLQDFKSQQESTGRKLPALPKRGTLDIEEVRNSLYFFG